MNNASAESTSTASVADLSSSTRTLIVLNPNAGSGRAGRFWKKLEPLLWQALGELIVAVTQRPSDVAEHLEKARAAGVGRVIAIGGDGTNHSLVNELARLNRLYHDDPPMTFGCIPIGTGQDWSRTLGIPADPIAAVQWIKQAQPVPVDLGYLQGNATIAEQHFLNIASVGLGGETARRINNLNRRWPWTFYTKTLQTMMGYKPPIMRVFLDGKLWWSGKTFATIIANGQIFGHGMRIAPQAAFDDGLFDVILIEAMPRLRVIRAFNTVYSGEHILRKDVHSAKAKVVEVESTSGVLPVEFDGESTIGNVLRFEVRQRALQMLARSVTS